eukprot:362932-Chlamydomonas_euryale.AAC.5
MAHHSLQPSKACASPTKRAPCSNEQASEPTSEPNNSPRAADAALAAWSWPQSSGKQGRQLQRQRMCLTSLPGLSSSPLSLLSKRVMLQFTTGSAVPKSNAKRHRGLNPSTA